MQFSLPPLLLGSLFPPWRLQLVYEIVVPDGLHTHVFSDLASVPPIHTMLPSAALTSSAFSAADCTVAN